MTDAMPLALQTVLAIVKIHARANAIGAVLRHAQKVVVVVAVKVVQDNAETIARVDVLKLVLPHVPKVAVPNAHLIVQGIALEAVRTHVPQDALQDVRMIVMVVAAVDVAAAASLAVKAIVGLAAKLAVIWDAKVLADQLVEEAVQADVFPIVTVAV